MDDKERLKKLIELAKERIRTEEENWFYESSQIQPLSFTRQNVYNFCVKAYTGEKMKAAAEKVLDEEYLPSHSEMYREVYKPSYRVLYRDYKKFKREDV